MGIKIKGFKLGFSSLDEAYDAINCLRPETHKMVELATSQFLAKEAQGLIDNAVLYPDRAAVVEDAKRPLSSARAELVRRQKAVKETGYRDALVDFDFSVVLFKVEHYIIGMLFAEYAPFIQWFDDLPWVREFSYYDGSDSYLSRGITEEQWRERLRVWKIALNNFRLTPAEAGMEIELARHIVVPQSFDVLEQIDTKSVRALRYAKSRIRDQRVALAKSSDMSDILAAIGDATKFMGTSEGIAMIEVTAKEIEQLLPDITKSMIV